MSNYLPSTRLKLDKTARDLNKEESETFCAPFVASEMNCALKSMSNGKSAGPDKTLPEFLKNLGNQAKGVLLKFLNKTWKDQIPSQWRKATILPFLKKGKDARSPTSYRPISLTSVLCKLVERIIANRLQL